MNDWHYWHRQLCGWLANNPHSDEADWPLWSLFPDGVRNMCFACEEAGIINPTLDKCEDHCPLDWVPCWRGVFLTWKNLTMDGWEAVQPPARDDALAADIVQAARRMRDTPVRIRRRAG